MSSKISKIASNVINNSESAQNSAEKESTVKMEQQDKQTKKTIKRNAPAPELRKPSERQAKRKFLDKVVPDEISESGSDKNSEVGEPVVETQEKIGPGGKQKGKNVLKTKAKKPAEKNAKKENNVNIDVNNISRVVPDEISESDSDKNSEIGTLVVENEVKSDGKEKEKVTSKTKPKKPTEKKMKKQDNVVPYQVSESGSDTNSEVGEPVVETEEKKKPDGRQQGKNVLKTKAQKPAEKKAKVASDEKRKNSPKNIPDDGTNDLEEEGSGPAKSKPKETNPSKSKASSAPDKKAGKTLLNKVDTDIDNICFNCDKLTKAGESFNFKIVSWNVAGIRAWVKKNGLKYVKKEMPDILCLQEVKCEENKLPPEVKIDGYHVYWSLGTKAGYAGVGLYTKEKPIDIKYGIGMPDIDSEGRVIIAEFEKFYLVCVYVPNAGDGLKNLKRRMEWDVEFRKLLSSYDKKKPVIIAGDMNVSHQPIDLANPKTNTKSAGFTQEERDGMTALLSEGFVDTFRYLYPDMEKAYTYWTYLGNARSRNTGWRLDYFVMSEKYVNDHLCDNIIRNMVYGSDHCPIILYLHV